MLEITATELERCDFPGCGKPIVPDRDRIVYMTADSKPVHARHVDDDGGVS